MVIRMLLLEPGSDGPATDPPPGPVASANEALAAWQCRLAKVDHGPASVSELSL